MSEAGCCFILMVWCRKTAGAQENHDRNTFFFLLQTRKVSYLRPTLLGWTWDDPQLSSSLRRPSPSFHQVHLVMAHWIVFLFYFITSLLFWHLISTNTWTFVYILLSRALTLSQMFPTISKAEKSTSLLKVILFGCHYYRTETPDSGGHLRINAAVSSGWWGV